MLNEHFFNKHTESYDIATSKKQLIEDINTLHKFYDISRENFLAGKKVVLPVSIAREYNKYICRMHVILEDLHNNLTTFPNLSKQVKKLLNCNKQKKLLSKSEHEVTHILKNLKKNCENTFHVFSEIFNNFNKSKNSATGFQ